MLHPFESSGLGTAPFQCTGVTENEFRTPDGNVRAGGACDYCGTNIRWEFWIKSANGSVFKVGCDCVQKTGWGIERFETVRAEHIRARRAAGTLVRKAARELRWSDERAERKALKLAATAGWREDNTVLVERLQGYAGSNEYLRDMRNALGEWGSLTEGQHRAVLSSFAVADRLEASRAASTHLGDVGDRVKGVKLRIEACIEVGKTEFYPYLTKYLVKLATVSGDSIVWWTTAGDKPFDDFRSAAFTVKAHDIRDGVKQTIVNRVRFDK